MLEGCSIQSKTPSDQEPIVETPAEVPPEPMLSDSELAAAK